MMEEDLSWGGRCGSRTAILAIWRGAGEREGDPGAGTMVIFQSPSCTTRPER